MDTLRRAPFVEAKAREALEKTDQSRPPTNLDAVARHYGISVRRGARGPGAVAHFDAARNEIVLGEFIRWPYAHELGHALLGHGTVNCETGVVAEDAESPQAEAGVDYEAEANRFARHLLVPREMVEFLLSRGNKIPDLARRFEVSENVVWLAVVFYGFV
jgi:Zn-dependent peptidase ImmA (M78 family)